MPNLGYITSTAASGRGHRAPNGRAFFAASSREWLQSHSSTGPPKRGGRAEWFRRTSHGVAALPQYQHDLAAVSERIVRIGHYVRAISAANHSPLDSRPDFLLFASLVRVNSNLCIRSALCVEYHACKMGNSKVLSGEKFIRSQMTPKSC